MGRIVREAIDPAALVGRVSGEERGGIATFLGIVRAHNAGKQVVAVEYQAYDAMAEKVLERIEGEARRRFGSPGVALVHRIGRLDVGEISLGIAVGAPHRKEALAALACILERVKRETPIWKREFYRDGSEWLEPGSAPLPGGTET